MAIKSIAILSNINMDPIKGILNAENIYTCMYGQYIQELVDENSYLNVNSPEVILFSLDGEEFIKDICYNLLKIEEAKSIIEQKLNDIFNVIRNYLQKRSGVFFIFSNLVLPSSYFMNYLDTNSDYSISSLESYINEKITIFSKSLTGVYILDWKRIVLMQGYKNLYDDKFWYLGRIKWTNKAFRLLSIEIENILNAIKGNIKKVLILDLDNTLWGEIIGEEGIGGIQLSEDGIGKCYRDFQALIKSLKNLGVLLAINSKNNPEDVQEVFDNHPMMLLKKDDFVLMKINWDNKIDNIKEIAQELNLGTDSFVFIDDNQREREMVRQYLPEVAVPDFPDDPSQIKKWFLESVIYKFFPKVFLTDEDKQKFNQYQAGIKRKGILKELTIDEFIKKLEIKLEIYLNDPRFIKRIAQLTQKTNQFNMTTIRYSESDIKNLQDDEKNLLFTLNYKDTFGDEGVTGCSIIKTFDNQGDIDTFLLSCRIIGRRVEYTFLYKILKILGERNIKIVRAKFIPTRKNEVAKDFYLTAGFRMIEKKDNINFYEANIPEIFETLKNKILSD